MKEWCSVDDDQAFEPILAIIRHIGGNTCGGLEPRILYGLSRGCQGKGLVVEIGSLAGRSTIALAFGLKVRGQDGSRVIAVDYCPHEDLESNLQRAGVADWVTVKRGRSSDVSRGWTQPIELLFIDGNHSLLGCRSDILCWTPHVIEGGLVVFHDYGNWDWEGVHQAVHRYLLSRPREWRTIADREAGGNSSMYVLQRIAVSKDVPGLTLRRLVKEISCSYYWLKGELRACLPY